MELKDYLNSKNIALYMKELPVEDSIDNVLFPAKKQLSTKLEQAKGSKRKPVALRQSRFDAQTKIRTLESDIKITSQDMPLFKEGDHMGEEERRNLALALQSNNTNIIEALTKQVFENYEELVQGARIVMKRMRCEIIQKGKISFSTKDGGVVAEYGVPANHVEEATTNKWNVASADIIGDIKKIKKTMRADNAAKPTVMLMTENTFESTVMINTAITNHLLANPISANTILTSDDYLRFLKEKCKMNVVFLEDTTFIPERGGAELPYYEDGYVTFSDGTAFGNTVYSYTAEEYDATILKNSGVDVAVVDNAIAITTIVQSDPVAVEVKVSVIGMPSFEKADDVYFLKAY